MDSGRRDLSEQINWANEPDTTMAGLRIEPGSPASLVRSSSHWATQADINGPISPITTTPEKYWPPL